MNKITTYWRLYGVRTRKLINKKCIFLISSFPELGLNSDIGLSPWKEKDASK